MGVTLNFRLESNEEEEEGVRDLVVVEQKHFHGVELHGMHWHLLWG